MDDSLRTDTVTHPLLTGADVE